MYNRVYVCITYVWKGEHMGHIAHAYFIPWFGHASVMFIESHYVYVNPPVNVCSEGSSELISIWGFTFSREKKNYPFSVICQQILHLPIFSQQEEEKNY